MFKVNEIFQSIQGEGLKLGILSIFIRFSGCNLKCSFCDTNHQDYQEMTSVEILNYIIQNKFESKNIILTGGEPVIQDNLIELINNLKDKGYTVSMESNGSGTESIYNEIDWLTISPKNYNKNVINNLKFAKEVKIVINEKNNVNDVLKFKVPSNVTLILQPESNLKGSFLKCQEIQKILPNSRVIPQVHKLAEWK